ncbi:MAG: helix-turn-helix domain-containing protein [Bacilli bacterium]
MNKEKMANFLVALRKEKNLLQQEVAEIFMVTPQAVSKWEKGESIPDIEILQKLSEFYNVTLEEILEGERKDLSKDKNVIKNVDEKKKRTPLIISSIFLVLFIFLGCFDYLALLTPYSEITSKVSLWYLVLLGNANLAYILLLGAIVSFIGACIIDIVYNLCNKHSSVVVFVRNLLAAFSSMFLTSYTIYYALYFEFLCDTAFIICILLITYFILLMSLKVYREQNKLLHDHQYRLIYNISFLSLVLPSVFISIIDAITFIYADMLMLIMLGCAYIISYFTKKKMKVLFIIENSVLIVLFIIKIFSDIGRTATIYILIILIVNLILSLALKFFRKPKIN